MTQDPEDISLKVLRILYHYQQENPSSGLAEENLIERFNLLDVEKDKSKLKKVLSELKKLGLVEYSVVEEQSLYTLTDKGIMHYEQFKFINHNKIARHRQASIETIVEGDWHGSNNHSHHHHEHIHQYIRGKNTVHFPGETQEFIPQYIALLDRVKDIENLVLDSPNGDKILKTLDEMKTIINLNSSALGGKLKWEKKLESIVQDLEEKAKEICKGKTE